MRTFFINSYEIKKLCCLFFAAEVILYACIAPFIGQDSISLSLIWQMAAISILLTAIQYALYTSNLMMNMNIMIKVIIHYLLLIGLGYLFARIFKWFDLSNFDYVGLAVAIFTGIFIITTMSIGLYTKLTGERFNEKLKVYKDLKMNKEREED